MPKCAGVWLVSAGRLSPCAPHFAWDEVRSLITSPVMDRLVQLLVQHSDVSAGHVTA